MRVSTLYQSALFKDQDAYVVGLGPSMQVFPVKWLEGRLCVLLNDAQKHHPTLGPVAFANHMHFLDPRSPAIQVAIVKGRLKSDPSPERDDNHCPWDHPGFYCFSYRMAPFEEPDHRTLAALWRDPDHYWGGGTVASFAIQFLLLAGVRSITLVGCDCIPLRGKHYSHATVEDDRARWSKKSAFRRGKMQVPHDYAMYTKSLQIMQHEARERFKVPIMTLTPFVGLADASEQFRRLLDPRILAGELNGRGEQRRKDRDRDRAVTTRGVRGSQRQHRP